jgi:LysM repeat protein
MIPLGYPLAMHAVERVESGAPHPTQSRGSPAPTTPDELPVLCPYLASVDGTWRSSTAVREHRCVAATPPVPLALEKQRRLCLVADHTSCATYLAAEAARPPVASRTDSGRRVIARTTPVILDHGRFDLRLPAFAADRRSGQGLLLALLGLAFVAVLIARPAGGGLRGGAGGTPAPTGPGPTTAAVASAGAVPSSPASQAPVITARPIASAPTASGGATPPPASGEPAGSGATYRVRSGDTLTAIAARFGTTVKVLVSLNKIADPSKLKVGQVLRLP